MRRAAKVDANQTAIVLALRQAGASVAITSMVGGGFPDAVVALAGINYLFEFKTEKGKLTPDQLIFHRAWSGRIETARTIDDALRAVGLI